MFDLTTIQLRNFVVGTDLDIADGQIITARRSLNVLSTHPKHVLGGIETGEELAVDLDDSIDRCGFTHGQWEEWQSNRAKATRPHTCGGLSDEDLCDIS